MPHFETRMGPDGTIAVPEPVRTALNLKAGDIVDFYLEESGRGLRLRARNIDVETMAAMFRLTGPVSSAPLSQEEIDNAIGEHLSEEDERIVRDAKEWDEFQQWRRSHGRAAE